MDNMGETINSNIQLHIIYFSEQTYHYSLFVLFIWNYEIFLCKGMQQ